MWWVVAEMYTYMMAWYLAAGNSATCASMKGGAYGCTGSW